MIKKLALVLVLYSVSASPLVSQNETDSINAVWNTFYQAFRTLDANLMAQIHSKDLVRISGAKRVLNYEQYIANYRAQFDRAKTLGQSQAIVLRFFERLYSNESASDRGYYRLTITDRDGSQQHYYGEFHVIFRKEDSKWKIVMDYDSNEGHRIDETVFLKAFPLEYTQLFNAH